MTLTSIIEVSMYVICALLYNYIKILVATLTNIPMPVKSFSLGKLHINLNYFATGCNISDDLFELKATLRCTK